MSMYLTFTIGKDRRNLVKDISNFHIDHNADSNNPQWLQARQNEDSMRQVFVTVKNEDDTPFDLTGCNIQFEGKLPDGIHRVLDAKHGVILDAQAGQFRFDMPKQAFAVAGSYVQAFFRLVREGDNVSMLEFDLEVLADLVINDLVPSDYITPFEDLYSKLKDILNGAQGDFDTAMTSWKKEVADVISQFTSDVTGVNLTIEEIKTQLANLEDKILADGLATKAEIQPIIDDVAKIKTNYADIDKRLTDEVKDKDAKIKALNDADTNLDNRVSTAQSGVDANKLDIVALKKIDTLWSPLKTDMVLLNGYELYGSVGASTPTYCYRDGRNEDDEIVREVEFRMIITKKGSQAGDEILQLPEAITPTYGISIPAGGSGSDFYEYSFMPEGNVQIHGTTMSNNDRPWMAFMNRYTFVINKDDPRWYAVDDSQAKEIFKMSQSGIPVYSVEDGEIRIKHVSSSYELAENETFEKPEDGIYLPARFEDGKIVGSTPEEHAKAYPNEPVEPSEDDKLNAKLALQIAQNKAEQDKFNAQILLQIAKNNGGVE